MLDNRFPRAYGRKTSRKRRRNTSVVRSELAREVEVMKSREAMGDDRFARQADEADRRTKGEPIVKQNQNPTRRQFLRGAGGAWLLLPFLPSLAPKTAKAQAMPKLKRFVYLGTEHGGASFDNLYGTLGATGSSAVDIWSGFTAHSAPLAPTVTSGKAVLSPVLTAPSSLLTTALAKKMNVIRGIDFANTLAHQEGGHLGNNTMQATANTLPAMVTIDQVMAYSPNFYGSDSPRMRSINIGGSRALSWTYTNPADRTGVQKLQRYNSSLTLFQAIFGTSAVTTPTATRPLIIDRVIENYRSLRTSNRRLSSADRVRLDDHVGRLTQLQQQLASVAKPLSCGSPAAPADNVSIWDQLDNKGLALDQQTTYYKLMADVLITAFSCAASRIAVFHELYPYSTYQGDWHQDIAHQDLLDGPQATLAASYQQVFEHVFLYLAAGLDAVTDADGKTVLDNTMLVWGQECGYRTHEPFNVPLVMAGSAGGYFKTGMFVDYRNQTPACQNYVSDAALPGNFSGLVYPQFLATALYAMGIAASEWTQPTGVPGYGAYLADGKEAGSMFVYRGKSTRDPNAVPNAGKPLPIITAG
jgi:hypothetical protein